MIKNWVLSAVTILVVIASPVLGGDYSLPTPPREFFVKLHKTKIPPGKSCCTALRGMLVHSVAISPYLAAKLFREGRLLIADTRSRRSYDKSHVFGAISLPEPEVDFMNLKRLMRLNMPIALY